MGHFITFPDRLVRESENQLLGGQALPAGAWNFPPIGRRAASRILIAHLIGDVCATSTSLGSCPAHRNRTPLSRPERAIERAHNECPNRWSTRSELPALVQACGQAHHKDFSPRSNSIRMIGNLRTERSGSQLAAASRSIRREHPQQDAKRPVRLVLLPRANRSCGIVRR